LNGNSQNNNIPIPDAPKSFPELEKLTDIQLERLCKDPAAIAAHVSQIESVKSMQSLRDQIRDSNFENTRKNLLLV
jgi:hypothetical protein